MARNILIVLTEVSRYIEHMELVRNKHQNELADDNSGSAFPLFALSDACFD